MTDKPNDGGNDISHLPTKEDAFVVMPIILVTVLFIIETVFWYIDIFLLFIIFIEIAALIITAGFLWVGIKHLVHGRYKSALSLILIIPVLILSFAIPSKIFTFGLASREGIHLVNAQDVAYYIKLTLHEKQYLEAIKLIQPDDRGLRYKAFIWSGRYGEGTELVYDESDELELSQDRRSQAWWKNAGENSRQHFGEPLCPYGVNKIKAHFYVVSFSCG